MGVWTLNLVLTAISIIVFDGGLNLVLTAISIIVFDGGLNFELSPDRHFHHIPVLCAYHCSTLPHQLSWGQHLVPPMAYITYVEELDPVWHSFYNFYDGPVSAIDWPYTEGSYLRDEVSETSLSVKLLVTHLTSAHNYLFQHNLHRFL